MCQILAQHGFNEVRRRGSHIVMQRRTATGTVTVPVPDYHEIRLGSIFGDGFGDGSVTILGSIPFLRESYSIPRQWPKPVEITAGLS